MDKAERRKRQNEKLLSVMKSNILLARSHKKEGRTQEYFSVMAFVRGMMYACGMMRPQFGWAKKIDQFYEDLEEQKWEI